MSKIIAIDGACRRNGQPDCISAGACFILDEDGPTQQCYISSQYEECSTSQRGELTGLILALDHISSSKTEAVVVTDSEYLFNTITKEWVYRWSTNGWVTAQGEAVKNHDLWQEVLRLYDGISELVTMYHIKGHLLSIGVKKYHELMRQDNTGYRLFQKAFTDKEIAENKLERAVELSLANNGFVPSKQDFQKFASMNLVADAVANICIETAEAKQWDLVLNKGVLTA